jgi:hypothetical protein
VGICAIEIEGTVAINAKKLSKRIEKRFMIEIGYVVL